MTSKRIDDEVHERIRVEHEELRELLGAVHQMLARRVEAVDQVAEKVASLREHVESHFREEEVDGFFQEIVEQAPRLANRAAEVVQEHAGLLDSAQQLKAMASDETGTPEWWKQLEDAFHAFSKALMRHEHRENELLQTAYGLDIGPAD